MGVTLQFTANGRVFGFRQAASQGDLKHGFFLLWDTQPLLHSAKDMRDVGWPFSVAWKQTWIHPSYRVDTTKTYRLAVMTNTVYFNTPGGLSSAVTVGHIKFLNSFQTTLVNPMFGTITTNTDLNGVDVLFSPD